MARPTKQEIETRKAKARIAFYLAGGTRLVYVSRGILTALLLVILAMIWWQG